METSTIVAAVISRRSFLRHTGFALGALTLSSVPRRVLALPEVAAAPVLSLCADKPYLDCSGAACRYEPRGTLNAARPLMALSEAECRMLQPFM